MHASEKKNKEQFEQEGWVVYRNGWPDFALVKDGILRLVEVKAGADKVHPVQEKMFALLEQFLGVKVEVIREVPPRVPRPTRIVKPLQEIRDRRSRLKREKRKLKALERIEKRRAAVTH